MESLKDEATHIDIDGDLWKDVVFDSEGNAKEGVYLKGLTWLHSTINKIKLKPIEKREMKEFLVVKEYLDPNDNYSYHKVPVVEQGSNWIEVPKGCDYLVSDSSVNFFLDRDLFNEACFENLLWSRNKLKEFLVNHDDKWTLQLLDADTEENSYRVAVPTGEDVAYMDNDNGEIYFTKLEMGYRDVDLIWQRSEDFTKVTIDDLKHRVYKKDVSHLKIVDVYRVLELFGVESHAVGHAIKKLLLSGGRGAKDEAQDIQEAIDSLIRYQEMKNEDE